MEQRAQHGEDEDAAADTVAFVGAGAMGEAIVAGLVRSGKPAAQVIVSDASPERVQTLVEQYAVRGLPPDQAVAQADTVLLAVKPKDVGAVLEAVSAHVRPEAVVVSIAAGVTTATLEAGLPDGTAVVRVMPNTPALVGEGIAALSPGTHCADAQLARAEELLGACGRTVVVPETSQNAVTAVSGSGPAYVFAAIEAMIEGGVGLGLPRDTARELVVQTVYGAATMVRDTGEHPSLLRERVSSPGGTTVAALRELDDRGVRAAYLAAMEAAARRSGELSEG